MEHLDKVVEQHQAIVGEVSDLLKRSSTGPPTYNVRPYYSLLGRFAKAFRKDIGQNEFEAARKQGILTAVQAVRAFSSYYASARY